MDADHIKNDALDLDGRSRSAVDWLLSSAEPAVRSLTRRDLLGEPELPERDVLDGPMMRALLSGQRQDGAFGDRPYDTWVGAHWRLVSLVELGVPAGEPRCVRACDTVLGWLTGSHRHPPMIMVNGLPRCHASIEGNAVAVASRLGLAADPRVASLVGIMLAAQWPDGGWNCDRRASGRRSSFHETLPACWGLYEYYLATGEADAHMAALRAAELFLQHRLFRSLRTGEVIRREWLALHYPPYWHYDILQALHVLDRMGLAGDPRCADAFDVLHRRRLADGRWRPGGYWWRPSGSPRGGDEVVDWGRSAPNEMITLNALRAIRAASVPA